MLLCKGDRDFAFHFDTVQKQNWNVRVAREREKVASAQVALRHAAGRQLDVSAELYKAMSKKR